jgi:hypothetical protein
VRCLLLALVAPASLGLVVPGPEPSQYERAPQKDPGWRNVGERKGRSAVYLGEGWVLTAGHVGVGPVRFEGKSFPPVPDSAVAVNTRGVPGRKTDLLLFRVDPAPDLPVLGIRKTPVRPGTRLLMVGYGLGRGDEASWMNRSGYRHKPGATKRWGTNRAQDAGVKIRDPEGSETICFHTQFRHRGTKHEAQAAPGDSGGAVFAKGASRFRLAGLMLAVVGQRGQPRDVALYGDRTSVADLTRYRAQIMATMGRVDRGSRQDRRIKRAARRSRRAEAETPEAAR